MEILSRLGDLIQEFIVMVILTVAFAWMVSKLVAIVADFQQGKLSITRAANDEMELDSGTSDGEDLQQDSITSSREEGGPHAADTRSLLQASGGDTVFTATEKVEAPTSASISSQVGAQTSIIERGESCSVSERGVQPLTTTPSDVDIPSPDDGRTEKKTGVEDTLAVEKRSHKAIDKEDEEDWEGIEAGELEEEFDLAATFVASSSMGPGIQASQDTQLLLYALYKQATVGQCIISQPSAFNLGAKAKWDAWRKLGKMDQQEAMARYIGTVSQIYPHWNSPPPPSTESPGDQTQGSSSLGTVTTADSGQTGGDARGQSSGGGHGMGPVFSSLVYSPPDDTQPSTKGLHELHVYAKDGNVKDMKRLLEQGISPNETDGDGCTPLHWAADHGHLDTVNALLAAGASINAQDGEGQTPLHYAITCDYKDIAETLLKAGADVSIPDKDGVTPAKACPPTWDWKAMALPSQ